MADWGRMYVQILVVVVVAGYAQVMTFGYARDWPRMPERFHP